VHAEKIALIDDGLDIFNPYLISVWNDMQLNQQSEGWHGTAVAGMMSVFNEKSSVLNAYTTNLLTNENVIRLVYQAIKDGNTIINISLSSILDTKTSIGLDRWNAWQRVASYAKEQGCLLITSAGNNGVSLNNIGQFKVVPAMVGNVITIGALSKQKIAVYSNYGSCVNFYVSGGDSKIEKMLITTKAMNISTRFEKKYTDQLESNFIRLYGTSLAAGLFSGWLAS
jgi:subtilisin family serine protease